MSITCFVYSLFFGCHHGTHPEYKHYPINISSIRIIETSTNYGEIIQAMTTFDNIISGNYKAVKHTNISSTMIAVLKHLCNDKEQDRFDLFIYQTWDLFLSKKREIKIDMAKLNSQKINVSFLKLLFGGQGFRMKKSKIWKKDANDIPRDDTNLLRFDLFKNLETVTINEVDRGGKYWPFSLLSLLYSLRNQSNIKGVYITGVQFSWLSTIWEMKQHRYWLTLKEEYRNIGYFIDYKGGHNDYDDDCISINKT